jgi:hypothetical protein
VHPGEDRQTMERPGRVGHTHQPQIGDDQAGFFKFYRRELAPRLS